jgi:hypothetical protein
MSGEKRAKNSEVTWNSDGYYDLSFGVHKSRRYHSLMRDFNQTVFNHITASNAFAASGAFFSIVGGLPYVGATLSGIVALASLFDLIFRYETRAREHHDLCARFTHLAKRIETSKATPKNLAQLRAERLEIEADEQSCKRLIDIRAQNEEARARGVSEAKLAPLTRWQCRLGYIFTYGLRRLEEAKGSHELAADEGRRAA